MDDDEADSPGAASMQAVVMLRAVIDGRTYESVATDFGITRTAVERRVKAVAIRLCREVGIEGMNDGAAAFVRRLRERRGSVAHRDRGARGAQPRELLFEAARPLLAAPHGQRLARELEQQAGTRRERAQQEARGDHQPKRLMRRRDDEQLEPHLVAIAEHEGDRNHDRAEQQRHGDQPTQRTHLAPPTPGRAAR